MKGSTLAIILLAIALAVLIIYLIIYDLKLETLEDSIDELKKQAEIEKKLSAHGYGSGIPAMPWYMYIPRIRARRHRRYHSRP